MNYCEEILGFHPALLAGMDVEEVMGLIKKVQAGLSATEPRIPEDELQDVADAILEEVSWACTELAHKNIWLKVKLYSDRPIFENIWGTYGRMHPVTKEIYVQENGEWIHANHGTWCVTGFAPSPFPKGSQNEQF